ncbi:MAG TPA: lactoylglutathione lyase [Flavobacterium sp.]|nr:lactoylglutathione lyase [Flavobacterium sp.]HAT77666.1 lactoylglutathione lyase [Flavobacterium sp.]
MGSTVNLKSKLREATLNKQKEQSVFKNFVSWFEIPAYNHFRSVAFYNYIYGIQMTSVELNGFSMGFFPAESGIGGAIVSGPGCVPSEIGPLLYLNGGEDLNNVLSKVNEAGGRVVMEKTFLSESAGYFAMFIDSEGNRLALHSKK